MVAQKDIRRVFRDNGWLTRLYLAVKLKICPVRAVETYIPRRGTVVDLGCGNGLMAALCMLGSEDRRVLGFDLDPAKVKAARRLKARWPSLEFEVADLTEFPVPACDAVILVDVLYLIPKAVQETILRRSFQSLRPGGVLVLKEMDTEPRWKYVWNMLQETLAVKVIGFTLGSRFHFRSQADFRSLLQGIGFEVRVIKLDAGYWYPHTLYLCRKP